MNLSGLVVLCLSAPCLAQATFVPLGFLPATSGSAALAVSPDGSVGVGVSGAEAFRWSLATGMVGLGHLPIPYDGLSTARAVSSNGEVIGGDDTSFLTKGFPTEAFVWTEGSGMEILLPAPEPGHVSGSHAYGVSWDGMMIVGRRQGQGCRWIGEDRTFVALPTGFSPRALSGDGVVCVGRHPQLGVALWTESGGVEGFGVLPGGMAGDGIARAASGNGSALVGFSSSAQSSMNGSQALRWSRAEGIIGLGDLPGGRFDSEAYAVSADGEIVVGVGATEEGSRAFIWDSIHQMRNLKEVLSTEFGLRDELQGWILYAAQGISADGRVICGAGANPAGDAEAWVVYLDGIEEPCPADWNHDAVLNSQDFFDYLAAFFTTLVCADCPNTPCRADFNRDCAVTSGDFFDFLAAFFAGCG